MGVAPHLTTTGGINVTTATGLKICIFDLVCKSMHEFEWYQPEWLFEMEELWKGLKNGRKVPVEEHHFYKRYRLQ